MQVPFSPGAKHKPERSLSQVSLRLLVHPALWPLGLGSLLALAAVEPSQLWLHSCKDKHAFQIV